MGISRTNPGTLEVFMNQSNSSSQKSIRHIHPYIKTELFDITINGIQLIERADKIELYNDPFNSVPLFIANNTNGDLTLFSDFSSYYDLVDVDRELDHAGFWEIVLFGSALWTRTLYKNVKQLVGASRVIIDKRTNEYVIERYWDYSVKKDDTITSIEQAADGLHLKLEDIFSKLEVNKNYLLGMSGGLDSRITLAYLSKYIPPENLRLFTYGFDSRILEFQYAKMIASSFGYQEHEFHKITEASYKNALDYLPRLSGGQIGINHCHIIDYLAGRNWENVQQISTYFSDAIFGYDCVAQRKAEDITGNYYLTALERQQFLPDSIRSDIVSDALRVYDSFDPEANYSTVDEFKYVTERSPKFHMHLAAIQGGFINNSLPYANYDLLVYMLSVPIEFRAQKKIVDCVIERHFKNISSRDFKAISSRDFRSISSRVQWGGKYSGFIDRYYFKFINRANALLRIVLNGKFQIFNKYQTEKQENILRRHFSNELKSANTKFVELGIMTSKQKELYDRLPLRSTGTGERYSLISLAKIIS